MKYSVRLAAEVAKLHNWTGTRRRTCTMEDGETKKVLVFDRKPVEMTYLPPEVAADSKLIVTEIPDPEDAAPKAPDLSALGYKSLLALAKENGLEDLSGKAKDLRERLEAHLAANPPAGDGDPDDDAGDGPKV